MEIGLRIRLPRDRISVPVARHVVRSAIEEIGVTAECADDIEVALSEACTNVLMHAGPGAIYDVRLDLDDERCVLRIIDLGRGFDLATLPDGRPMPEEERGRGLPLMSSLVDRVRFESKPEIGTVVHLEKRLVYDQARRLREG
jgi:anti-sigma regulatory factor (Ser/Thr protein kinase)